MLQRLTTQLPYWAQPGHPLMRYELVKARGPAEKRAQYLRAFVIVLIGVLLFGGGYLIATDILAESPGQNVTESAMAIVYWPLVILQVLARIGALGLTANTVIEEKRRQTWDNLRATQHGAELTLRSRWASVFYRLRGLLALILALRIALILGILFDLTAFQGRYLDLLVNGIEPSVPLVAAALLLALSMTANLLLPFSAVGFDAALGMLLATVFEQRTFNVMGQLLVVALRIAMVALLLFGSMQFTDGSLDVDNAAAWALVGGAAAAGDWGLAFLNLSFFGEIWATIPFGIFFGLALLIYAIAQAAVTDVVLSIAIRRAERKG